MIRYVQNSPHELKGRILISVRSVAPGFFKGPVLNIEHPSADLSVFDGGGQWIIMVPALHIDYFPLAARSIGVISRRGGTFSHLAIVLREIGLPGVVLRDETVGPFGSTFFVSFPARFGLTDEMTCEF